jgi:hypothetical protein
MTTRATAGLVTAVLLFGTLACARSMARPEDTGAARDTSEAQNPPGYRGMERDTTQVPTDSQPTPSDTFIQEQGTGVPEDTAGYSGLEHPDTTGAAAPDTSGAATPDTSGAVTPDTSGAGWSDTTSTTGVDTSGQQ